MKSSYVPPAPPVQCWPWLQKYGVNIGGRLFIRISTTPRTQTETTLTLGGGGGTTTIIKDGRLFIRYRYYSIFALFHFDCAVSTALMATTSVSCRMDL
jgi:hypothetical protein